MQYSTSKDIVSHGGIMRMPHGESVSTVYTFNGGHGGCVDVLEVAIAALFQDITTSKEPQYS